MKEDEFDRMRSNARHYNAGALKQQFDDAIYCIGRLAVSDLISKEAHKIIDPKLDDMIRELHSMTNYVLATMICGDGAPMRVSKAFDADKDVKE